MEEKSHDMKLPPRALQNSDNAVRSEAEKTLMDAIKGAAELDFHEIPVGLGSLFEEI